MSFNKKVLALMKQKHISKAELAKAASIPYTTLDSMLKRDSDSDRLVCIFKIANYLGVSIEELVFDDIDQQICETLPSEELKLLSDFKALDERGKFSVLTLIEQQLNCCKQREKKKSRKIAVFTSPAAAGEALPVLSEDYDIISGSNIPEDASFGIRICGDSMEPLIKDGSIVWVKKQSSLNAGEIGIFILNNESLCKKLSYSNDLCKLVSLNPAYSPINVFEDDSLTVIGKVLI